MMIRSWMARLGQTRLTLVLCLLVLFTAVHSAVVGLLRWQVQAELESFSGPIRTLDQFKRPLKDPMENAAPFYQAASSLCGKGQSPASLALDELVSKPDDPQKQALVVAAYQPVFELMNQGHTKAECNYFLQYQQGFSMTAPNFLNCRRLAALLRARIAVAKQRGDWEEACRVGAQGYRWMRTFEPNNNLISLMIRVACSKIVHDGIKDLPASHLTREIRLEAELLKQDLEKSWDLAFTGERLSAHKLYEGLQSGRETLGTLETMGGPDYHFAALAYSVGGQPLLLLDELEYLRIQKRILSDPGYKLNQAGIYGLNFVIVNMLTPNSNRARTVLKELCASLEQLGAH